MAKTGRGQKKPRCGSCVKYDERKTRSGADGVTIEEINDCNKRSGLFKKIHRLHALEMWRMGAIMSVEDSIRNMQYLDWVESIEDALKHTLVQNWGLPIDILFARIIPATRHKSAEPLQLGRWGCPHVCAPLECEHRLPPSPGYNMKNLYIK
jgi:hypothetical protein